MNHIFVHTLSCRPIGYNALYELSCELVWAEQWEYGSSAHSRSTWSILDGSNRRRQSVPVDRLSSHIVDTCWIAVAATAVWTAGPRCRTGSQGTLAHRLDSDSEDLSALQATSRVNPATVCHLLHPHRHVDQWDVVADAAAHADVCRLNDWNSLPFCAQTFSRHFYLASAFIHTRDTDLAILSVRSVWHMLALWIITSASATKLLTRRKSLKFRNKSNSETVREIQGYNGLLFQNRTCISYCPLSNLVVSGDLGWPQRYVDYFKVVVGQNLQL